MYAQSVAIGPEFFSKSFNDYRDKYWAFSREIAQNSIDCGSTTIHIRIIEVPDDNNTLVIVTNDGEPMTREILVDKLLSLGSSGKDFKGAVGGFGKAKEILYFAHQSYKIYSGEWLVSGSGAGYDLDRAVPCRPGTRSAVLWAGLVGDELRAAFTRFIHLCDRREITFRLDGEPVTPEIPRFRCQRPLERDGTEWARLGVHSYERGLFVIRIGGIPMFTETTDYKSTIVLELQGPSGERLTANRDGLRYPYSTRFRELITQMSVDRRSALVLEKPTYTRYGGPKLRIARDTGAPAPSIDDRAAAWVTAALQAPDAGVGIRVEPQGRVEAATSVLPYAFLIKNCVGRKLPAGFDPLDVSFSDHAHWLARAWSGCLLELHALYDCHHEFSPGFIFSNEFMAEHEHGSEFGRVYYLNPAVVGKRRIRRRFTRADRGRIAAVAAHEFIHGGFDLPYHGEDFAGKLTDVMGDVLKHWRRFARHFT